MIEIQKLANKPWAVAQGRYTSGNGYMVETPRPTRLDYGSGIKFFEGKPVGNLQEFNGDNVSADELRNFYRVWRPEETIEAAKVLKQKGRLLIVGRPQSGKGTILFGVSDICDKQGIGYLMIDGHWTDSPAEKVIAAIEKADMEGKMIFFDSFDYLFAGSTKLRKQNKTNHGQRTREIIASLAATKTPLVLTAHDAYWANLVLDSNLIQEHQDFLDTLGVYNLPRYIESEESRLAFLVDHEYSLDEACSLLNLPNLPLIQDVLSKHLGDKNYIEELTLALKDYGVLKKLARKETGEINGFPDQVKKFLEQVKNGNEQAILDLTYLILGVHFESDLAATLRWQK